jgi:hypothetical protein
MSKRTTAIVLVVLHDVGAILDFNQPVPSIVLQVEVRRLIVRLGLPGASAAVYIFDTRIGEVSVPCCKVGAKLQLTLTAVRSIQRSYLREYHTRKVVSTNATPK